MGGLRSLQTPTGACRDGIGPHPGKKDEVPHSRFGGAAFQFPFHYVWTRTPDLSQGALWVARGIPRRPARKNLGRKAKPLTIPDRSEISRNKIGHLWFHDLRQVTLGLFFLGVGGTSMLGLWSQNIWVRILTLSLTK